MEDAARPGRKRVRHQQRAAVRGREGDHQPLRRRVRGARPGLRLEGQRRRNPLAVPHHRTRELRRSCERPVQAGRRGGLEPGCDRPRLEPGLRADRERRSRHPWGGPARRQPVRHFDRRARPEDRRAALAFPGGPPRHLGLRQRTTGAAVPADEGRDVLQGAGSLQQERPVLHSRPPQREPDLPGSRGARAAGRGLPARIGDAAVLSCGRAAHSTHVRPAQRHGLPGQAAVHAARRDGVRDGARR